MGRAFAGTQADALRGHWITTRGKNEKAGTKNKGTEPTAPAMRRGVLHHMAFRVTDVERSARFYVPVLTFMGYQCAGKSERYQDWKLMVEGAPHELSIVSVSPELRSIPYVRGAVGQHDHFAWTAASPKEVDLFYKKVLVPLAAAGDCTILDPPVLCPEYTPVYYAVFFADPDGLKFEFVFNPPPPLR